MKRIIELEKEIRHLEWQVQQILLDKAQRIAESYKSYFVYPCDAYIMPDIKLVRLKLLSCNPNTSNDYTEWCVRGWTLRIYGTPAPEYEMVGEWFKRVMELYLDESPLRKEQPSVEQMLQELKSSDNYLMSNPFKEEYESVFDS